VSPVRYELDSYIPEGGIPQMFGKTVMNSVTMLARKRIHYRFESEKVIMSVKRVLNLYLKPVLLGTSSLHLHLHGQNTFYWTC
jgi:hypothetical protein